MSDLQKALETTEATIEALQSYAENIRRRMIEERHVAGVKFKTWSPVGGDWQIYGDGSAKKSSSSSEDHRIFGHERPTLQQAEQASIEMKKFNRLLALRDELCGDDVVDWSDGSFKHYLTYSNSQKIWDVGSTIVTQFCTPFFAAQEHAQRACDMLNRGEVVL